MRKLGELNVVGTSVPVMHATIKEVPEGTIDPENGFAAYDFETETIYLRKWDPTRSASATFADLVHEFLHAAFWANGATEILRAHVATLSKDAREVFEEQLVRALAPCLVTAIDDLIAARREIGKVCK